MASAAASASAMRAVTYACGSARWSITSIACAPGVRRSALYDAGSGTALLMRKFYASIFQHLHEIVEIVGPQPPFGMFDYLRRRFGDQRPVDDRAIARDQHPVAAACERAFALIAYICRATSGTIGNLLDPR